LIHQAQKHSSYAWQATLLSKPDTKKIQLKITPSNDATPKAIYLFSSDGQVSSDKKQILTMQPKGSWLLTVECCQFSPKKATHLPVVLKLDNQYISIHLKYPQQLEK